MTFKLCCERVRNPPYNTDLCGANSLPLSKGDGRQSEKLKGCGADYKFYNSTLQRLTALPLPKGDVKHFENLSNRKGDLQNTLFLHAIL